MASQARDGRRTRRIAIAAALPAVVGIGTAHAASFDLFGFDAETQFSATYSAAWRLNSPDPRLVDTPGAATIPVPDYFKVAESANYDDGDRNFRKGALINNRATLLGELLLHRNDYGLELRGDAFYDDVYHHRNDNDSPGTISKTDGAYNEFSGAAQYYDGARARLLDAYVFGTWYFGDQTVLNLRIGQQIAAWGESLFFDGIALAQGPADATKANVPGADVKGILLPVNQISMQLSLNDQWTLLGQYKLDFKPTELNPVGEYFSVTDVVGPGAEFIYGLKNPLYLPSFSDFNVLSNDAPELVDLALDALAPNLPVGGVTQALGTILNGLDPYLPDLPLPVGQVPQPGTPHYINVQRGPDKRPSWGGQYGIGLKYQATAVTNIGLYWLRYHSTTPAPIQNYGYAPLIGGTDGVPTVVTTQLLNLQVPVTYNVHYFDGIHLAGLSFSTTLFGVNVAGEALYRDGADVLVDVDGGLLGPVPTPVRSKIYQGLLSGIYSFGPGLFWDSLSVVGEGGFIHVADNDAGCGPTSCTKQLTYTRDASAISMLAIIDRKNIVSGWDLSMPVSYSQMIDGQSSLLSGFGALMGPHDKRFGIGAYFTYLQQLTLGVQYSGFFGKPDLRANPYADRDNIGVTVKYNF
ncbi:MAG TPA: DUF1302 family protein [Solimonas sp.]|nr:DUF1302 family protein [Solimonas sp.]